MLAPEIFKANDIRGIVEGPQPQWDLAGARALGAAFVDVMGLDGHEFVMGRDMRVLGRELSLAFSDGARSRGASVIDIGLSSTDQLWFASGWLSVPGVQFTASHNPAEYNGIKFCHAGAQPISSDFMDQLRTRAEESMPGVGLGGYRELDVLGAYADKLHELVPASDGPVLQVVVDAGNGMAGHICAPVLASRGIEIIGLHLELDGSFPNHPPNPLEPKNLQDARQAVRQRGADLGLVFDGDADRCFIIDEAGDVVDPSVVTAMIALAELEKEPGATIVTNSITSWAVAEAVEGKGELVVALVGHTYVKAAMAKHGAIFGGEHSAHYYFRDFWSADTGMLAALHVIELLRRAERPLSALASAFDGYHRSGEINSTVQDVAGCLEVVERAYAGRGDVDHTDGLTVSNRDEGWWFNLRPSNTEPLLRLNVESRQQGTMVALRDDVLDLVARAS